jgi:hypothetical protein
MHSREATLVICDVLAIRQQVKGFDLRMRQLDQWAEDAMRNLPKDGA